MEEEKKEEEIIGEEEVKKEVQPETKESFAEIKEEPVEQPVSPASVEPNNNKGGNNRKLIPIIIIIAGSLVVIGVAALFLFGVFDSNDDDYDYDDDDEIVEVEDDEKEETKEDKSATEDKKDENKTVAEKDDGMDTYKQTCKESKFQVNSMQDAYDKGYYAVTSEKIKENADNIAKQSLATCCNVYRKNFDDISKVEAYNLITYLFGDQYTEKNIKVEVLDQMIEERYGIKNFSSNMNKGNISTPVFTDSDHVCTGVPGGGTNGPIEYKLKTSNSNDSNNIYTYNYVYGYYVEKEYKKDINITIKYKYDEQSKLYKLYSLYNDDNVGRE